MLSCEVPIWHRFRKGFAAGLKKPQPKKANRHEHKKKYELLMMVSGAKALGSGIR